MNRTKGIFPALVMLSVFLGMALLYAGSYAMLADNSGRLEIRGDGCLYARQYRCGGELAEWFYWPARYADVKLRPRYWGHV